MFLAAGVVVVVAIPPGLALGGRTRRLTARSSAADHAAVARDGGANADDGGDGLESTIAL
jgi:hypothetical protein